MVDKITTTFVTKCIDFFIKGILDHFFGPAAAYKWTAVGAQVAHIHPSLGGNPALGAAGPPDFLKNANTGKTFKSCRDVEAGDVLPDGEAFAACCCSVPMLQQRLGGLNHAVMEGLVVEVPETGDPLNPLYKSGAKTVAVPPPSIGQRLISAARYDGDGVDAVGYEKEFPEWVQVGKEKSGKTLEEFLRAFGKFQNHCRPEEDGKHMNFAASSAEEDGGCERLSESSLGVTDSDCMRTAILRGVTREARYPANTTNAAAAAKARAPQAGGDDTNAFSYQPKEAGSGESPCVFYHCAHPNKVKWETLPEGMETYAQFCAADGPTGRAPENEPIVRAGKPVMTEETMNALLRDGILSDEDAKANADAIENEAKEAKLKEACQKQESRHSDCFQEGQKVEVNYPSSVLNGDKGKVVGKVKGDSHKVKVKIDGSSPSADPAIVPTNQLKLEKQAADSQTSTESETVESVQDVAVAEAEKARQEKADTQREEAGMTEQVSNEYSNLLGGHTAGNNAF
jgi:hypothetical protein